MRGVSGVLYLTVGAEKIRIFACTQNRAGSVKIPLVYVYASPFHPTAGTYTSRIPP
jgi:hypothetical protein